MTDPALLILLLAGIPLFAILALVAVCIAIAVMRSRQIENDDWRHS